MRVPLRDWLLLLLTLALFLLAFGGTAKAGGDNYVTITELTGTAQNNRPFKVPRAFAQGDIQQFAQARVNGTPITTQCDVKTRHPDGSVRFAIMSFVSSLTASQSVKVDFVNQTTGNNTGYLATTADMLAPSWMSGSPSWDAEMFIDGTTDFTKNVRTMLGALSIGANQIRYWRQGSIVTEVIVEDRTTARSQDFGMDADNSLHPIYVLTFYNGWNGVRVDYILESGCWNVAYQNEDYALTLKVGPALTTVYTKALFTHYGLTRWRKTFWSGDNLDKDGSGNWKIKIDFNRQYMSKSGVIPYYDPSVGPDETTIANALTAFNATNSDINGNGQFSKNFAATGGREEIGLFPTWESRYLASFDPRLYTVLLGNADISGHITSHHREGDPAFGAYFGRWCTLEARPTSCGVVSVGPVGGSGWTIDVGHQSAFGYIAYLVTGDWYYMEEMQAWASYNSNFSDPGTCSYCRNGAMGLVTWPYIMRGIAWSGIRNNSHSAWATPDSETANKSWYTGLFNNNVGAGEGKMDVRGTVHEGTAAWNFGHDVIAPNANSGNHGKLPEPWGLFNYNADGSCITSHVKNTLSSYCDQVWMKGYLTISLGHARDLGFATSGFLKALAVEYINQVLNVDAGGPWLIGSYIVQRIKTSTDRWFQIDWRDWGNTWADAHKASDTWTEIDSASNDFNFDHGYPHIARSAMSYLTEYTNGLYSGGDAYNWLDANMAKSGYANNPKWAIVPAPSKVAAPVVIGATSTQLIISTPQANQTGCTIEVSESSTMTPLVNDVNPSLFTGANAANRTGNLTDGPNRIWVVGQRKIETGLDGKNYSRALQVATKHYIRTTCPHTDTRAANVISKIGEGVTKTVPLGLTHQPPPQTTTSDPGYPINISRGYTRSETWIDPETGVQLRSISLPGDQVAGVTNTAFASVSSSVNWTTPANILDSDADTADYSGASCGANCDWIAVNSSSTSSVASGERTDYIRLTLTGLGSDATAENRIVQVCLANLDGSLSCDPDGQTYELTLPTSSGSVTAGTTTPIDTWRLKSKRQITTDDIKTAATLRILIRKKTSTGTISISYATYDWRRSQHVSTGTGGTFDRCSTVPDGSNWVLCSGHVAGGTVHLYRINLDSGEVRFLGRVAPSGFTCLQDNALFSWSVATRMFCRPTANAQLLQLDYNGPGTEAAQDSVASFSVTTMITDIRAAIETFVSTNSGQYPSDIPLFVAANFNCDASEVNAGYIIIHCKRGSQDSFGWVAVVNLSNSTIIAATPHWAMPAGRWCTLHSNEPQGNLAIASISNQNFPGSGTGGGPYTTTLTAGIDSSQTTITVAGEPTGPSPDTSIQNAKAGDAFSIDSEYMRITTKNSATSWVVARGIAGTTPAAHSNAATVSMRCGNTTGAGPTNYPSGDYSAIAYTVWRFLDDPYGSNANGSYEWMNAYAGHQATRLNRSVGIRSVGEVAEGSNIMLTPDFTRAFAVVENTRFAGAHAAASGNTWQAHPSWHQVGASAEDRQWFTDIRPFVGSNTISVSTPGCDPALSNYPTSGGCAAARVSGTTNVYKYTTAGALGNDGISYRQMSNFAVCSTKLLRDISGPSSSITDSTTYSTCIAKVAGECRAGSSVGDLFLMCPSVSNYYCTSTASADVCWSDQPADGAYLGQFGIQQNTDGTESSRRGWGYSRALSRAGLGYGGMRLPSTISAKALTNGRWIVAQSDLPERRDLVLVKVPPTVKDTPQRATFVPVPVTVAGVPAGTSTAVAEFWYPELSAYQNCTGGECCTTDNDGCVAVGSSINETTPFYWARETFTGLSCASGCTLVIPGIGNRVVYYRVKFRNAGGAVIGSLPVAAIAIP